MKPYWKLAVLFAVAATVVIAVYLARTALTPMSAMIAKERNRLARSMDRDRALREPAYAHALEERLHILGYQLAMAYNDENKPDKAIEVLQKLIEDEHAKEAGGAQRNPRSYLDEARYYEAMAESYGLKNEEDNANKARHERIKLLGKASELRKQKNREEGGTVRSDAD